MKSALQFLGSLTQSLNMLSRSSSWMTLGSLHEEARAISQLIKAPQRLSSDWAKKDWPVRKFAVPMSKEKGYPSRDKRGKKQSRESPSRVHRQNELKRLARELRKSRRGYNLPSTESRPRSMDQSGGTENYTDRYSNEARLGKFNEAPYWHSWSPCSRKCYQEHGKVEVEVDSKKPSK